MKGYIMNILFAMLISIFAGAVIPPKWEKYLKTITGLIIIAVIAAPIKSDIDFKLSEAKNETEIITQSGEETLNKSIQGELEKRVTQDISSRLLSEFNTEAKVSCSLKINDDNKISGVASINLQGDNISDKAVLRLYEIYSPEEVLVNGYKKSN